MSLYVFPLFEIWSLRFVGDLGNIVGIEFNDSKVLWFIDEELAKNFAHPFVTYLASCSIGIVCISILIMVFKDVGLFTINLWQGGPFTIKISEMTALYTVSAISCTSFVIWVAAKRRRLEDLVEYLIVRKANSQMTKTQKRIDGIEELHSLEASIHSLAGDLGVSFPIYASEYLQDFIQEKKMEILSDPAELNRYISERIEIIKVDKLELKKAKKAYMNALQTYDLTIHEVSKTGSIPIIRELENIYGGLTSAELKTLIPDRKWTDFMEVLNAIVEELKRLSALAIKYREECGRVNTSKKEKLTEKKRAYHILGISTSASSEEIKKVYHALALIYHGDKRIVQDDTRMKEINWAYKFLRNLKHF